MPKVWNRFRFPPKQTPQRRSQDIFTPELQDISRNNFLIVTWLISARRWGRKCSFLWFDNCMQLWLVTSAIAVKGSLSILDCWWISPIFFPKRRSRFDVCLNQSDLNSQHYVFVCSLECAGPNFQLQLHLKILKVAFTCHYPLVNKHGNGKWTCWRCIPY